MKKLFRNIILFFLCGLSFIANANVYTRKEVSKHTNNKTGIWVIYKNKVYDITNFVTVHPGGRIIMQAAGKDIGLFWDKFLVQDKKIIRAIPTKFIQDLLKMKKVIVGKSTSPPMIHH